MEQREVEEEEECQYFEEELEEEEDDQPQQQQWGSSSTSTRKLPFARGGPIFVPDLVSSPTSVPQFLSSFLQHLYDLEAELAASAASEDGDSFDDELSVDELRVFTEEELVEKALEDGDFHARCSNSIAGGSTISGKEIICSENRATNGSNLGPSSDSTSSSIVACETDGLEGKLRHKKNKKRGRVFDRDSRAAQLEGSYFAKVKELAKLKQKQDEDKLAAKLHSFRSNSKPVEESVSTSEKTKRMRSLRFITSSVKVKPCTSKAHVPLRSPEVVLCVEIYHKKNISKKVRRNLYWTPCAAHCIDLMLKDIANDQSIKPLIQKSHDLICFIYNHGWTLSIMRTEIQNGELVRPAITRFATNFLALDFILKHQADLKRMTNTIGWTENYIKLNRKDREKANVVVSLIDSQTYWRDIAGVTSIFGPLVKVLRMVDSDDKAEMCHLYEAMDRAKFMIKKNIGKGYKKWWTMIDKRWDHQLHQDIPAAGYFLNPKYQYSNNVVNDDEILNGFHRVVNRMVNDNETRLNINRETQEFLVLGSQLLSELRDNIYCLTDKLMQTAGQHDPSGYFLIEDTFFNDLRDPSSSDYSKPIFDWLNNCKNEAEEKWQHIISGEMKKMHKELLGNFDTSNLPIFKSAKMDEIRFSDLHFRLGAGYLYCHQGNCKHIIVIRDMRSVHPEDVQNEADYPLLTFQLRPRHRKCQVCKIYHVSKMTVDDKWAPRNPCYFCIKCYFLLHYKEDGSLLYPHSVYDYYHELMPTR